MLNLLFLCKILPLFLFGFFKLYRDYPDGWEKYVKLREKENEAKEQSRADLIEAIRHLEKNGINVPENFKSS